MGESVDSATELVAGQLFKEGVEALDEDSFVDASSLFSQCLQVTASKLGDDSVRAALVCVKYGASLLGCARLKGTTGLGSMAKVRPQGLRVQCRTCIIIRNGKRLTELRVHGAVGHTTDLCHSCTCRSGDL